MSSDVTRALQCETDFLSGVEANLESAKGKYLRGTIWHRAQEDEQDRLIALMASYRNLDRSLLKSLPANRRIELHGFERRFFWGKRATGVAIASVLSPLEHYASLADHPPPPVGLGELKDHLQRLMGRRNVPHVIGVCSPSGFTDEARTARLDLPSVTVVLVEPVEGGGWCATSASGSADPRVLRIFDPENANQKMERVRQLLDERRVDLLTGGLSVESIVAQVKLPADLVKQVFEQEALKDPELKVTKEEGDFLLYRGAPVARHQETKAMGVMDRIRQMFSKVGNESEKIDLLAARRAALSQRRDRIYEDINKLELKEAKLLEEGKAAKSSVPRRRLAAQVAQLRKDIARHNTTASMLNQQINIISTDIHNLTLIQQGEMAKLPSSEELTENAVHAEELLETLRTDSERVGSLMVGMEEVATSDEELSILKEFEEGDTPKDEVKQVSQPSARKTPAPREADETSDFDETPLPSQTDPPDKSRGAEADPL